MSDIHQNIGEQIAKDDVVLYMKGTPVFPQCGFSAMVVQVLSHTGVKFQAYNVLEDQDLREGIKSFSNWPTIPQLYVKGEFVGGCDIVRDMYETGELTKLLEDKGVSVSA
jgi:monothiol glutaredoxin